jgi:hypothetical protein
MWGFLTSLLCWALPEQFPPLLYLEESPLYIPHLETTRNKSPPAGFSKSKRHCISTLIPEVTIEVCDCDRILARVLLFKKMKNIVMYIFLFEEPERPVN